MIIYSVRHIEMLVDEGDLSPEAYVKVIEAEPALKALHAAKQGLLAACAVVEPRSPAFKLIEEGLKATNEVLNK